MSWKFDLVGEPGKLEAIAEARQWQFESTRIDSADILGIEKSKHPSSSDAGDAVRRLLEIVADISATAVATALSALALCESRQQIDNGVGRKCLCSRGCRDPNRPDHPK